MKKVVAFFVVMFSVITSVAVVLKQWVKVWTANDEECQQSLAGDDIIENPNIQMTNAVTIKAKPEYVWQWLVQMGGERAGWYSYDTLDNDGVHSAEEVLPEYQDLQVGDVVKAMPNTDGGFEVAKVEKPLELVYTTFTPLEFEQVEDSDDTKPAKHYFWRTTWAFVLNETEDNDTRLLVRARVSYHLPEWLVPIAQVLAYPVHFIMQQRQLANVRERAERYYSNVMRLQQATINA